jgi:hypothetical protein
MPVIRDRLAGGGGVPRDRDPVDRRGIVVRALRQRNTDLLRLYSTMNTSIGRICAAYEKPELQAIADFLGRTADAGQSATAELAGD